MRRGVTRVWVFGYGYTYNACAIPDVLTSPLGGACVKREEESHLINLEGVVEEVLRRCQARA